METTTPLCWLSDANGTKWQELRDDERAEILIEDPNRSRLVASAGRWMRIGGRMPHYEAKPK